MNHIEQNLGIGPSWWSEFISKFPSDSFEVTDHDFSDHFPKKVFRRGFGTGYVAGSEIESGFSVLIWNFCLQEEFVYHERSDATNQVIALSFFQSSKPVLNKNTALDQQVTGLEAIHVSAFADKNQVTIPAQTAVSLVSISFTPAWLSHHFSTDSLQNDGFLSGIMNGDTQPILLNYPLNDQGRAIVDILLKLLNRPSISTTIQVKQSVYELLVHFFELTLSLSKTLQSVSTKDMRLLSSIEYKYTSNIEKPLPPIAVLAKEIGMSESKFKLTFKQLYGKSVYDYFLSRRMEKVKQMIATRAMGVSEAGQYLGYRNLSNFTIAFKKYFGYLPSETKKY